MTVVGQNIGRYRILEQVGSGGMSVVYRGLDTALEREVAVKVLHPHLARKEDSRRRLTREAKAVAKLQHPNILEVFDFAAADEENAYIVTEYIHGQTLAEYCARRPFDPPELGAMVIHQVASALAHAHEAGVIKLTDFGIAKVIDRDDRMTITGTLVGSPAHMAPEIIEGQDAGAQADVFSLGTILYFLTARQLPFSAPSTTATLKRILDGSYPDPRSLSPTVSDELAGIIAMCLARDPAARYPHAGKLRDALAEYLSSLGIDHVTEELTDYFADPDSYGPELSRRLCDKLVLRAQTLWKATRPAKALSSLNHVLALQPNHTEAKQLLEQIDRARRRARTRRQRLVMAGAMAGAALLLVGAYSAFNRRKRLPDYQPGGSRLAEVQLPSNAYRRMEPLPAPVNSPPLTAQAPLAMTLSRPPVGTPAAKSPKPKLVKFTIQFRPYGYARVDGGPEGAELPHHEFDLTPGRHRLVYGCRFCEEKSTVFEVDGQSPLLNLLVEPKWGELRFNVDPPDALVTIGNEQRVASESARRPFRVPFPPGITQQRVSVQITRPGFKARTDVLPLLPSDLRTINRILEPE